jgi:hypothetical protein
VDQDNYNIFLHHKKLVAARRWWLTTVIIDTQEAEIRRIVVQGQSQENSSLDTI